MFETLFNIDVGLMLDNMRKDKSIFFFKQLKSKQTFLIGLVATKTKLCVDYIIIFCGNKTLIDQQCFVCFTFRLPPKTIPV